MCTLATCNLLIKNFIISSSSSSSFTPSPLSSSLIHLTFLFLLHLPNRNLDKLLQQVDTLQNFLDLLAAGRQAPPSRPNHTTGVYAFTFCRFTAKIPTRGYWVTYDQIALSCMWVYQGLIVATPFKVETS